MEFHINAGRPHHTHDVPKNDCVFVRSLGGSISAQALAQALVGPFTLASDGR